MTDTKELKDVLLEHCCADVAGIIIDYKIQLKDVTLEECCECLKSIESIHHCDKCYHFLCAKCYYLKKKYKHKCKKVKGHYSFTEI
jgi:hypothetical protein